MSNTPQTRIDFNDLSAGTVVDDEFAEEGVTIRSVDAAGATDAANPVLAFDTANPTGGDTDLASDNLGTVLILSEDGDTSDPDDNAAGGIFEITFNDTVTVDALTLLDVEEGAWIKVLDAEGNLLRQIDVRTADGGQTEVWIDTPGAASLEVMLAGSGAIDNLVFTPAPALDGVVDGTEEGDLIDLAFVDADGDRIDANDALGVEGTFGDADVVAAGAGNDTVRAGEGDDILRGGEGYDVLLGQSGNDTLDGGADADRLLGGADQDLFVNVTAGDIIDGGEAGADFDTLDLTGLNADVEFAEDNPENGTIFFLDDDGARTGETIVFRNIESIVGAANAGDPDGIVSGTSGADLIDVNFTGDPDGDRVDNDDAILPGEVGDDDIIVAGGGLDTIFAGDGDDEVFGGEERDLIDGGLGDDSIEGGTENDTIFGREGDDTILGNSGSDSIEGNEGADSILGGSDNDVISGGDADDTINGESGRDLISGDDGSDVLIGSTERDTLLGGAGDDTLLGGEGRDLLEGQDGDDSVVGGTERDTLLGGEGDDTLEGNADRDTLLGGAGDDNLTGGGGADLIEGGDDRDVIFGATTGDVIDGGAGGDDFDTLILTGSGVDFITFDEDDAENGTVTFDDGGTARFEDIEAVVPCFTPGTMIATPRGEIPVEDLRVGDRVITRDNGIQVIRWVGARRISAAEMNDAADLRAVRIGQGALGHGLPERDMTVSPQHRVLIANDDTALYFDEREVLVAAKHLVGRPGIVRMGASDTVYVHVMFDNHEVILSDGAWTESFQPGDHSLRGLAEAQRRELLTVFPELRDAAGRENYVAARRMLKRREADLLLR